MHLLLLINFFCLFCLFHSSHFVSCLLSSLCVHCKTVLGPCVSCKTNLKKKKTAVGVGEEGEEEVEDATRVHTQSASILVTVHLYYYTASGRAWCVTRPHSDKVENSSFRELHSPRLPYRCRYLRVSSHAIFLPIPGND